MPHFPDFGRPRRPTQSTSLRNIGMIERDSQSAETGQAEFAAESEAIRRNFLSRNGQRPHLRLETPHAGKAQAPVS
jgi:hypothetical protein